MGLCLFLYRAPLLLGGLLSLLLLAVSALQAGRPSPVVLGETRVQSWGLFSSALGRTGFEGRQTTVFPVYICSEHGVGERMTVLPPESVCPPPAILGAVWSTSLSLSSVEYGGKWECYCAVVHRSSSPRQSQTLSCLVLPYPHIFTCKKLSPLGPTPEGGCRS